MTRWTIWRTSAALTLLCAIGLIAATGARAYVYWGSDPFQPNGGAQVDGGIGRANLDGSGYSQYFADRGSNNVHHGLAVDGAHIYWGSSANGQRAISRANLDGSGVEPKFIDLGHDYPNAVAVDGAHVYWASSGSRLIGRANLDGSVVEPAFMSLAGHPAALAVDGAHIYWFGDNPDSSQDSGVIGRANLDGSGVQESFISGLQSFVSPPAGLAVDDKHVYWTESTAGYGGGAIGRANLDGSGVNRGFVTNIGGQIGYAYYADLLALASGHLYWLAINGPVGCVNVDGSGANPKLTGNIPGAFGLAADGLGPGAVCPPLAGGGGDAGGGAGGGATAPHLSGLSLDPGSFHAASSGASAARRKKAKAKATGTRVSYTDSQAATTTFTVTKSVSGVRHGRSCVTAPPHPKRGAKRCTLTITLGNFNHADQSGAVSFRFTGRVSGHALTPGSYRLTAVARQGAKASSPVSTRFTIKR